MVNTVSGGSMFEQAWTNKATNVLKAEIKRSGIGYEELVKRLAAIGVDESYKDWRIKLIEEHLHSYFLCNV